MIINHNIIQSQWLWLQRKLANEMTANYQSHVLTISGQLATAHLIKKRPLISLFNRFYLLVSKTV